MSEITGQQHEFIPETKPELDGPPKPETSANNLASQELDKQPSVEALQSAAEAEAKSATETSFADAPAQQIPATYGQHKDLKNKAYQARLAEVKTHLAPTDKILSAVVHNKYVDGLSTATASTVGRPSGLLAAGIFASIGSAVLLLLSRHYGFSYNYGVFLVLIAVGYIVGLILEALYKMYKKARR